MSDLDGFRQDFARLLARCARDRRAALCGGVANGDDLKVIALFERLARDAETLDPAVFGGCRASATAALDMRAFVPRREALLAQVGVFYWPKDAADLLGRMRAQFAEALDVERGGGAPPPPSGLPGARAAIPKSVAEPGGLIRTWASDFTAGFGIVAPLLSLWTLRAAFGQWQDRAVMAEHASVPATVISIGAVGAGRSSGTGSDVVLAFQPPSGETCRVTWHTGLPPFTGAPGDSVPVVPRSSVCELPLIPSQVGDPAQSFALAAALMAGGLASLKLWAWLFRTAPRPITPLIWTRRVVSPR